MWKYKNQIKLRWISAGLFLISLAVVLFTNYSGGINHNPYLSIRAQITQASLNIETAPVWAFCAAFTLLVASLTAGVPSAFFMALLLPFFSIIKCFAIVYLGQILASILSMHISRIKKLAEKAPSPASHLIMQKQTSADDFAFWSRLYFSVPLRTADMHSVILTEDSKAVSSTLKAAAPAIFLRMLIPSCWLNSIIAILPGLRALPVENYTSFYMCSAVMIAYTLLPRIPELLISSKSMKHVIRALEDVTPPIPTEKIKRKQTGLGLQPSKTKEALQN